LVTRGRPCCGSPCQQGRGGRCPAGPRVFFFFSFTLVTGPSRSLSLKLRHTRVYEPYIRTRLGTSAHFCIQVYCTVLRQPISARTRWSLPCGSERWIVLLSHGCPQSCQDTRILRAALTHMCKFLPITHTHTHTKRERDRQCVCERERESTRRSREREILAHYLTGYEDTPCSCCRQRGSCRRRSAPCEKWAGAGALPPPTCRTIMT